MCEGRDDEEEGWEESNDDNGERPRASEMKGEKEGGEVEAMT